MGLKWFVFLIKPLDFIGMWFSDYQTLYKHMFKRGWIVSSNTNNNSTLDNERTWEGLCIQLKNQQTCTQDNRN